MKICYNCNKGALSFRNMDNTYKSDNELFRIPRRIVIFCLSCNYAAIIQTKEITHKRAFSGIIGTNYKHRKPIEVFNEWRRGFY